MGEACLDSEEGELRMGFSEVVQWWEEWQLRILVLTSLFLQYFLFVTAALRKHPIPAWFRFLIWLAYLGSDAVAIYALAALFNRHKNQEQVSTHQRSTSLQVFWAPILLLHLGGQNGITAYNIEDNELWRRHVLTAVSQVAVTIYVFSKTWSRKNEKMLVNAIPLLFPGVLKCLLKPWDPKRVSINSLVDSSSGSEEDGEISSFHEYIQAAVRYFQVRDGGQTSDGSEGNNMEFKRLYGLFVDLAPAFSVRLICLKILAQSPDKAHHFLQLGLSAMFSRLYTKASLRHHFLNFISNSISPLRVMAGGYLFGAIPAALYHMIRRKEAYNYNHTDINITYALLVLTFVLELVMSFIMSPDVTFWWRSRRNMGQPVVKSSWSDQVAQYNLLGYLARNKKHRNIRKLATLLVCKDYLDQLWCMKSSKSSGHITKLISDYVTAGWQEINDITTYHRFNDNRGQWTLGREGLLNSLGWSLRRPFDETVLLWHLATDFYFHHTGTFPTHEGARNCKEMSNYMIYLLFVNPEMLIAGARRSLFKDTYEKLKDMTQDKKPPLGEKKMAKHVIRRVMANADGSSLVHDAWSIAQDLIDGFQPEDKMWRVIQGVWVEMLCFSAGRCRGYLHAKSLGKGGEYLSYVWLLLSYIGMETLAEKMQRTEMQEEGDMVGTAAGMAPATPATATHDHNV